MHTKILNKNFIKIFQKFWIYIYLIHFWFGILIKEKTRNDIELWIRQKTIFHPCLHFLGVLKFGISIIKKIPKNIDYANMLNAIKILEIFFFFAKLVSQNFWNFFRAACWTIAKCNQPMIKFKFIETKTCYFQKSACFLQHSNFVQ